MASLRSPELVKQYQEYLKENPLGTGHCPICESPALQTFTYWKIIENKFPYDLIAEKHHMIVPLRHIQEVELQDNELAELREIKKQFVDSDYDYVIESTSRTKSIPGHLHIHLLVGKSADWVLAVVPVETSVV